MRSRRTSELDVSSRFYLLEQPGDDDAFRAKIAISSGQAFALKRAEWKPNAPIEAHWAMGSRIPGDVIWTTLAAPMIVSERFVEALGKSRFQGWSTYPVMVFGKSGESIDGFHGLSVYGRCGPIVNEKSARTLKQFPGGMFPVWKGLFFDFETWRGTDIFMPEEPSGWVFVTREVQEVLSSAGIKNVVWTPQEEVERSVL